MFPTLLIPTPALSVVPGIDTYFSNVVLLAHCDGVDGGTTFEKYGSMPGTTDKAGVGIGMVGNIRQSSC